ncbi:1550_t:CDS:1, partial [Dentiscutata heterogama]
IESSSNDNNNIDLDLDNKLRDYDLELVQILSFYLQTLNQRIFYSHISKSNNWIKN